MHIKIINSMWNNFILKKRPAISDNQFKVKEKLLINANVYDYFTTHALDMRNVDIWRRRSTSASAFWHSEIVFRYTYQFFYYHGQINNAWASSRGAIYVMTFGKRINSDRANFRFFDLQNLTPHCTLLMLIQRQESTVPRRQPHFDY